MCLSTWVRCDAIEGSDLFNRAVVGYHKFQIVKGKRWVRFFLPYASVLELSPVVFEIFTERLDQRMVASWMRYWNVLVDILFGVNDDRASLCSVRQILS